jgi:hypothetical protein
MAGDYPQKYPLIIELEISKEITYFQSGEIFKPFIKDLCSKLQNGNQKLD